MPSWTHVVRVYSWKTAELDYLALLDWLLEIVIPAMHLKVRCIATQHIGTAMAAAFDLRL